MAKKKQEKNAVKKPKKYYALGFTILIGCLVFSFFVGQNALQSLQNLNLKQDVLGLASSICSQKYTIPGHHTRTVCSGVWGTHKSTDGFYFPTWFGCYGTTGKDPNDNCLPACQHLTGCNGLSGAKCERTIRYFVADAGRYPCNSKVMLTNPKTGKTVVARVIDLGYASSSLRRVKIIAVSSSTPLGPINNSCNAPKPTPHPVNSHIF